ncbi:sulfatase-like hydrolase/transferase [Sediminibacillus dalangtanensis]|uniref:Sulfatase-like hydrolase/transferase n=1 Tax=Sediminibacillus dalangtanensis TaxID=2729421 RepID=A0ABX7VMX3_9BACI|nr:sulfatase [Sediminibacillus dalangtanensis]QTM98179.1 sulfatase-like hydrolase/transferase [Sediminibacillus dalangtanensis]
MKILYIDIDALRPDHLGCYGYHRNTSPNIDRIAEQGVRFTNHYASDVPCAPSRSALFSSQFGIHNGVVNHGGLQADMRPIGKDRPFNFHDSQYQTWVDTLRSKNMHTAIISPFPGRHEAWHILRGFLETYDTGKHAGETADDVTKEALDWLESRGRDKEDWFLYLNVWDPHTPYRTPASYGNPFEKEPAPEWLTEERIAEHRASFGPYSARDLPPVRQWPGIPEEIHDRNDFKAWVDGYDTAIRYVDEHIGKIIDQLEIQEILEETIIIISADHGENQGELNVYGDHQLADHVTCRIPFIISGPGIIQGHVDEDLHYQIDVGPTLAELADGKQREKWDGRSFLPAIIDGKSSGRPHLVVSQCAWSCQRGVRFDNWMLIRTYHDGLKELPDFMLFDIENDPHETNNLIDEHPEVLAKGLRILDEWVTEQMKTSDSPVDPMWSVIHEGGPFHTRDDLDLDRYLEKLHKEGRNEAAARLEQRYR